MAFDFRRTLASADVRLDEEAANGYIEELCRRFAASPEGEALTAGGGEPGYYLDMFLDYALQYSDKNPAALEAHDIQETLSVIAEKVISRPEDLDRAIPELEAFCDFVGRAFDFRKAAAWKRAIQAHAKPFHAAVRDPRRWGMAKAMMMEGLARGFDLDTKEGINRWLLTYQTEQLARLEAEAGLPRGEKPSPLERLRRALGFGSVKAPPDAAEPYVGPLIIGDLTGDEEGDLATSHSPSPQRSREKEKARRRQAKASRRRNR